MPARSTARLTALAATTCAALLLGLTGTASAADTLNCDDFTYQEDAQAVFERDRTDPNHLDGGQNGADDRVACESLPHRPGADESADPDATEPSIEVPETVEEPDTSTTEDSTTPEATTPDTITASEAVAPTATADRDCADFPTQAEAQAALAPGDPERLDADSDGIACEQQFGTEDQQVAVHPVGGVATGGTPLR